MKNRSGFMVVIIGLLAGCPGFSQAAFEAEQPGARPAGMAGAFSAVADDCDALNYNPAGLAQITTPMLGLNYARLLTGLDDGSLSDSRLAYIQPLGGSGSLGASFYQRQLAGLYQENTWSLGYGLPLAEGLYSAGVLLKLFNQKYLGDNLGDNPYFNQGTSVSGWGLDAGGMANLGKNLTAGLSFQNVNQPNLALGAGSVSVVAMQIRTGLAYREETWSTALEALWRSDAFRLSAGGEAWWFDRLIGTRLGVAVDDQGQPEGTLGLSLRIQRPIWTGQLDYAFINPFGDFAGAGPTHQFNLTLYFGAGSHSAEEAKAQSLMEAGRKAREAGRWEEALDCWEQARVFQPDDASIVKAIEDLKAAIQRDAEIRMRLQQAKVHTDNGRLFNAVEEYRKILALAPDQAEASRGLEAVQAKIQRMTQAQQAQQEKKEQEAARQVQLAKQREANAWIQKAGAALDKAERDSKIRLHMGADIRRLRALLEEARASWRQNDSEHAQVAAQSVLSEAARLSLKNARQERVEAVRKEGAEKEKPQAKDEADESAEEPQPEAPAPKAATPPAAATLPAVVSVADSNAFNRSRKKARGAYGLAVKLMLDIEKANGPAYYPAQYQSMKQELSKVKALLKSEDYDTAIRCAEKLFTPLQKLKEDSQEKEKASKAMPTTW